MKRTREENIQIINSLFPFDSAYEDTRKIGEILLIGVISDHGLESISDDALNSYAAACLTREKIIGDSLGKEKVPF